MMTLRPLLIRLDGATMEHVPLRSGDGLELGLTRVARGDARAAVLVLHGVTASSAMFALPETRNLVDVLLDAGLEVWLLDWRGSCRLPYNESGDAYTFDDVALHDIPPAVAVVRARIGARPLFAIAHCTGALSLALSLTAGLIPGLAGVVAQGVFLTPKMALATRLLLATLGELGRRQIGVLPVDFRRVGLWSKYTPLFALTSLRARWSGRGAGGPACNDPTCQMFVQSAWGIGVSLYVHDNLHPRTHDRLTELLGPSPSCLLAHFRKMALVQATVPWHEADARYQALPASALDEAGRIDCPVLLVSGAANGVWLDSNKLCADVLARRQRTLDVRYVEIAGYGHMDPFVGRAAAIDVFPHITRWLDERLAAAAPRAVAVLSAPG
jgi:alpha-beta hydrolase superfamily lysophospholipase